MPDKQRQLLEQQIAESTSLTNAKVDALRHNVMAPEELNDTELIEFITLANTLYRAGYPIISDSDYDFLFLNELKKRHPNHPFLHQVEPEKAFGAKTVKLPVPMLSTEKAYTHAEIKQWLERIKKGAEQIGKPFDALLFRATPKLDGFAAYDDGEHLYTRGDGKRGTDITRVLERGLKIADNGARGLGAGEIVVSSSYFQQHLADKFENSRNFQASVVKEKELEPAAATAIAAGAAVFYPFSLLPYWEGSAAQLINNLDKIFAEQLNAIDYDVDGVVIEVTAPDLKAHLGATRHHHRWQIALKQNLESAVVKVIRVIPQTSRSGRVNPVVEVEPVRLSGAMIHRVTAHHYGMVKEKGIGPGAMIELTRSGEVIPKIIAVATAATAQIPTHCPSCATELIWNNDYLYCTNNSECPAQITHTIEHFFRTLGNIDGFGPATIAKLYQHGINSIAAIYAMDSNDFEQMGFGPKQSQNLVAQLLRSRMEPIEDWRFLAAFGIFRMGGGNCENLLSNYPLEQIFTLNVEQIIAIEGFAEKTAAAVVRELQRIQPSFTRLYSLGFNLEATTLAGTDNASTSPIAGKMLVFTGTMRHGSRTQMQTEAKKLGARVGSSISAKTDYLITGEKVGTTKIAAAAAKGVQVLTEEDYLRLIAS